MPLKHFELVTHDEPSRRYTYEANSKSAFGRWLADADASQMTMSHLTMDEMCEFRATCVARCQGGSGELPRAPPYLFYLL